MRKLLSQKIRNFDLFRARVKMELWLRGWTYADLAAATHYKRNYIQNIMCGTIGSRRAAVKIMKVLDIPRKPFL